MKTKQVVSKTFKEYRKKKNLTQAQMAELIDVSERHFSNLERGKSEPSFSLMVRIHKVCGFDLNEIADLINEPEGETSPRRAAPTKNT